MPRNRVEEEAIKSKFYGIAGFPGVLGCCIDGTHSSIIAPSQDECANINRKIFHSINVQSVCDSNIIFEDVVSKWPGSHHDSFILQSSALYQKFENNSFGDAWLLGNSGYPLKKWLMTPLSNPVSYPEQKYNIAHQKTRLINERAFGILKSRWRILDHRRSVVLRTSKSFENCYSLLRSAQHLSPKWFGFLRRL